MSTFVAPIGSGFGDVFISLPVLQALMDKGEKTYLVTRSFRQEGVSSRISGLAGEVREADLSQRISTDDTYINLRAHPIQTDHLWGTPEFEAIFGVTRLEKIITLIAADWGLDVYYDRLRPLDFNKRKEFAETIVFVPGSDGYYKHWPESYWLDLRDVMQTLGVPVTVLGRPSESPSVAALIERGLPWTETATSGDAIDVISSARAVVAVDTGLMHVAVQQGISTCAFIHPSNFHQRSARCCINLIGKHCPAECGRDTVLQPGITAADSLEVGLKFDHHVCTMPPGENCMAGLAPHMVLRALGLSV